MMTSLSLAWQFLTIFPGWKREPGVTPLLLGRSMAFYPVIGLILGLILWGVRWVFSFLLPSPLSDGLVILLLALFTGALHLDGLADTLDGWGGGKTPEEKLRIMKDHQIGSFGVVGLIFILGLKFLALQSLSEEVAAQALLIALVLSRGSMVQLLYRSPYARREGGLGSAFKENLAKREMVIATVVSLALAFFFFHFSGVLLWLTTGLCTLGLQALSKKMIGGVTGDVLGASNEINEVLALVFLSGLFYTF